jgi:hypothetical protein
LSGGEIGKTLFEQGFFQGGYAGSAKYVLQSCFVCNTGDME